MKKLLISILFLISSLFTVTSIAGNFRFLTDSPISHFSIEDAKLFVAAQNEALDHRPDGSKVTWQNPQSKAYGTIVPFGTTKKNNVVCRKLTIFNNAAGRTGQSTFTYCKINNVWQAS